MQCNACVPLCLRATVHGVPKVRGRQTPPFQEQQQKHYEMVC